MTPIAGFFLAVIAGWIIREPRRAAATVILPYLAIVAVQSWAIANGYGISPARHGYTVFRRDQLLGGAGRLRRDSGSDRRRGRRTAGIHLGRAATGSARRAVVPHRRRDGDLRHR